MGLFSTVTPPGDKHDQQIPYCYTVGAALSNHAYYFYIIFFARVEFTFNRYSNGTELVNAVQNLNYKGGNTRTGAGLKFVADNFFNPASSRDVPKVYGKTISSNCIILFNKGLLELIILSC